MATVRRCNRFMTRSGALYVQLVEAGAGVSQERDERTQGFRGARRAAATRARTKPCPCVRHGPHPPRAPPFRGARACMLGVAHRSVLFPAGVLDRTTAEVAPARGRST